MTSEISKFFSSEESLRRWEASPIGERLRRSSYQQHFAHIRLTEQNIASFEASELSKLRWLQGLNKTMQVFLVLFPCLLFLGMMFSSLPLWVPIVIEIPLFYALILIQKNLLEPKIQAKEHRYNALLYLRTMLKEHNVNVLHPIGEWGLPEIDESLRSDLMMRDELSKRHPKAAFYIERVVKGLPSSDIFKEEGDKAKKLVNVREGLPSSLEEGPPSSDISKEEGDKAKNFVDVEICPYVKLYATKELSQSSVLDVLWQIIRSEVSNAKRSLRSDKLYAYQQIMDQASKKALTIEGKFFSADLPIPTVMDAINRLKRQKDYFSQLKKSVTTYYEKIKEPYAKIPEKNPFKETWEQFSEKSQAFEADFQFLMPLFERDPETVLPHEWYEAARYIQKKKLSETLLKLIDQAKLLEKSSLSLFPLNRIAENEKELKEIGSKVLDKKVLDDLEKSFTTKDHKLSQSSEDAIDKWCISAKSNLKGESRKDIYERNAKIRSAIEVAKKKLENLKASSAQAVTIAIEYDLLVKKLDLFEKEHLVPIRRAQADISFFKVIFRKMIPVTKPFKEIDTKDKSPFFEQRKCEQKHVEKLLQSIDRKMLSTNRWRVYGVQVTIAICWIAEAVIFFYSTNPWIMMGFLGGISLVQLVSVYLEHRIRQMDQKKQGFKFQQLLRNRVDISGIPGNRPMLHRFKELQGKYGLDGVNYTWARVLSEGNEIIDAIKKSDKVVRNHPHRNEYEENTRLLNKIEKKRDELFEKRKEDSENFDLMQNVLPAMAFSPEMIFNILKTKNSHSHLKTMIDFLERALKIEAPINPKVDLGQTLEKISHKFDYNENIEEEKAQLKAIPKHLVQRALNVTKLTFEIFIMIRMQRAIEKAKKTEKTLEIKDVQIFDDIEKALREKGEIPEDLLQKLCTLSKESLEEKEGLLILKIGEGTAEIKQLQQRVKNLEERYGTKKKVSFWIDFLNMEVSKNKEEDKELKTKADEIRDKIRLLKANMKEEAKPKEETRNIREILSETKWIDSLSEVKAYKERLKQTRSLF